MCVEVRKKCECGRSDAQFHMRDNIMSGEVIENLYCPACSSSTTLNQGTMIHDNGWIIKYDMTLAKMYGITKLSMPAEDVKPEFLFDQGYATWREMYPGETTDIAGEREAIIARKDEDPKRYLQEINAWAVNRVQRLKEAGWRKALPA
ncbi:MAG: hypothetical protein V1706_12980 [Pseudomonadota bacterium]